VIVKVVKNPELVVVRGLNNCVHEIIITILVLTKSLRNPAGTASLAANCAAMIAFSAKRRNCARASKAECFLRFRETFIALGAVFVLWGVCGVFVAHNVSFRCVQDYYNNFSFPQTMKDALQLFLLPQ
jgi:hypothetical protein